MSSQALTIKPLMSRYATRCVNKKIVLVVACFCLISHINNKRSEARNIKNNGEFLQFLHYISFCKQTANFSDYLIKFEFRNLSKL